MPRSAERTTKPCEFCGKPVTKTRTEASQRRYWTCDASCANRLRIQRGNTPAWGENPYRGQQETRPCTNCGVPVTRYLKPGNVDQPWFHSVSCRAQFISRRRVAEGTWVRPQKPRRGDYVPCEWCGEEFYRQPAYIKQNRRFCSEGHWNEAQRAKAVRVEKVCEYCGEEFSVPPSLQAQRFCKRQCELDGSIVRPTGRMHNGRPVKLNDKGYVLLWEPDHPNANRGWMFEHRLVMEQHLGRYLRSDEQVDHIRQEEKSNNDISNLQVLSPSDHAKKTQAENLGALPGLREKAKRLEQLEEEAKQRDAEIATLRAQLHAPVLS